MSALILLMLSGQFFFGDQTERTLRETRKRVREYSDCVVKKHPEDARTAVLSLTDNSLLVKDYPKILDPYCLTGFVDRMAFPGDLLRYALADALVRKELINQPTIDPSTIGALAHNQPLPPASATEIKADADQKKQFDRKQWQFGVALAYLQVSQFGECVVRANPAGSRQLLASAPTSAPEAESMAALNPILSSCLAKNSKLYLTKEVLRGTIALNYYRLAKAPRITAGTVH